MSDWCFWKRLLPPEIDEGIYRDALKIKEGLTDPEVVVKIECFNEKEVNLIKSLLSEEEKARVRFTWLRFK